VRVVTEGELMLIVLAALGIFIAIQIMNGILNIMTARHLKKHALLRNEAQENENRIMAEQWENVIVKFSDIMESSIDAHDKLDYIMENLDEFKNPIEEKSRKRGKYKPRKPKALEHKKTPPET